MSNPLELHCGAEVLELNREMAPTRIGEYVVLVTAVGVSIFREEDAKALAMQLLTAPRTAKKKRIRKVKQ